MVTANQFNKAFDKFACCGESISCERNGLLIIATIVHDEDYGPPWEKDDGHGDVSEWTTREKRPGERVLCTDRSSKRYYDYAGAIAKAKAEQWDAEPYGTGTKGEQAVRAVNHDFDMLKAWCNNEWHWAGVVLSVSKNGVELDSSAASLWGIECNYPGSDNSYLTDVANELLDDAIEVGQRVLKQLCA